MFVERLEDYRRSGNNDPYNVNDFLGPHDKEGKVVTTDMKRVWIFFMVCCLDTTEPDQFLVYVNLKTLNVGMEEGGSSSALKLSSSSGKMGRSASHDEGAAEDIKEMRLDTTGRHNEVRGIMTNAQSTSNVAGKPTPLSYGPAKEDRYDIIEKRTMCLKRVKDAGTGDSISAICEKGLSETVDKFKRNKE